MSDTVHVCRTAGGLDHRRGSAPRLSGYSNSDAAFIATSASAAIAAGDRTDPIALPIAGVTAGWVVHPAMKVSFSASVAARHTQQFADAAQSHTKTRLASAALTWNHRSISATLTATVGTATLVIRLKTTAGAGHPHFPASTTGEQTATAVARDKRQTNDEGDSLEPGHCVTRFAVESVTCAEERTTSDNRDIDGQPPAIHKIYLTRKVYRPGLALLSPAGETLPPSLLRANEIQTVNELPADDANSIDRQSTASSSDDLLAALNKYGLDIPSEQQAMLCRYCDLLWEWNQKLNLTRHTDFDTFVSRDLWDTVQLSSWIEDGERVLDVGSGGGVPGLVLAILRPRVIVTVSDSIEKKTRALEDMVKRLGLKTQVANSRVQDLLPRRKYDTLIARAVGPTHKILRWVSPFWSRFRRMLLIKGPNWVTERKEARHRGVMNDVELRKLSSYPMFGTESESVILSFIRKTGNSHPDSADSTDEGETR